VAWVADCFELTDEGRIPADAMRRHPWLADHQHVEGPHCLVLKEVRALREPFSCSCKGALGLWNLPGDIETCVNEQLSRMEVRTLMTNG
jgi:hypothetical protein